MASLKKIYDQLDKQMRTLQFSEPVAYVYNPLSYARQPWDLYLEKYGQGKKEALLLGMNPGPWGMAQTGIPFGEVNLARDWLQVAAPVTQPSKFHPKKPIQGFACKRSEVSGRRLWGWAKERFKKPEKFFKKFLVINYCPLLFLHETGKNLTPEILPKAQREQISKYCNAALQGVVDLLQPKYLIGIGRYAEKQAHEALPNFSGTIGYITHPSPANPKSNRGWSGVIEEELNNIIR